MGGRDLGGEKVEVLSGMVLEGKGGREVGER